MDYRKYISYVKPGELKKSEYQFEEFEETYNHQQFQWYVFNSIYYSQGVIHRQNSVNYKEGTPITEAREYPLQYVKDYLEFHYSDYRGIKDDFLNFIEQVVKMAGPWAREFRIHNKAFIDRFIHRWISEKEKELAAGTTKSKFSKPKVIYSYTWENNPEQDLPELYNNMKGRFIANETSFLTFSDIFSNKPLTEIEPLKWHEDNASEVIFFIFMLEETSNIKVVPHKRWERLKACFVKPDNRPFNESLKNLKQNITINLSQGKQDAINKLVDNFL